MHQYNIIAVYKSEHDLLTRAKRKNSVEALLIKAEHALFFFFNFIK